MNKISNVLWWCIEKRGKVKGSVISDRKSWKNWSKWTNYYKRTVILKYE